MAYVLSGISKEDYYEKSLELHTKQVSQAERELFWSAVEAIAAVALPAAAFFGLQLSRKH